MAKDILDAIRRAEDEAKNQELEARDAAQKKIDDANAKAKQKAKNATKNGFNCTCLFSLFKISTKENPINPIIPPLNVCNIKSQYLNL